MLQQRTFVKLAVVLSVLAIIGFVTTRNPMANLTNSRPAAYERSVFQGGFMAADQGGFMAADRLRKQRNTLSEILNTARRELAVMSCKLIEMTTKSNTSSVAVTGGWCKHSSSSTGGQHLCDKPLAGYLALFFQNQTVASFGDGPGDYKKFLDSTNRLRAYDAFDGAPYGRETSGGVVQFADLTVPLYGLPLYDWIISLEVAEHIPTKSEDVYIDNIVRHAKKGIVLSWAVPGQGGLQHINNRPLAYVQNLLSSKGFDTDIVASKQLQEKATFPWLKRNVYVYRRRFNSVADPIDT
ncbi:uncharacterized protein LOC124284001 [Haliotis rubra]|uniref:uncharacterized protein LOC124284001 n=1 Tax=Haliotis rubra TaxID=36100 RepID=UPI001EE5C311|nr:uncharacterized protein LOC124284001 [Haliotis rubra]